MSSLRFLLFCLILGALFYVVVTFGVQSGWFTKPTLMVEIIALNVLATALLYRWLLKIHSTPSFNNAYLGSIVLKLFLYCGVLITVRIISPDTLIPNAILLLVCYALFTILEVTILFLKVGR